MSSDDVTRSVARVLDDRLVLRVARARLLVEEGPDAGREVALPERSVTVGRGSDADIRLGDGTVSRLHLRIGPVGDAWVAEDLGSRSGFRVNGRPVQRQELRDGDRLALGETALLFQAREELHAAEAEGPGEFFGLVADSFAMRRLFGLARKVAPLGLPVLIRGETGSGKEALARALHALGPNPQGPYEVVDCTLLRGDHVRSELFGHVRGAFTGAAAARRGAFERADGGTLFLDEVGELAPEVQAVLLRVLEEGEVRPLGAESVRKVDVRVVCATHRDLAGQVASGEFRRDLLYRLSAVTLDVPPLRERPGDVEVLARHFLPAGCALTPDALQALQARAWPGNVRELRAVLEVAARLGGPEVRRADLRLGPGGADGSLPGPAPAPGPGPAPAAEPNGPGLEEGRAEGERASIERALVAAGGHLGQAAELLGISRSTLYRRMRKLGFKG